MYTANEKLSSANITDIMQTAYIDYSMSVIISRALPDARDGLKPVQRRILYAMLREGLVHNRAFDKCAGVVGEVLKNYHPHGDSSVYDTLVRLAQNWVMRYQLIDPQGNFGSVDGDPPAAYRYTEARLKDIAEELLKDIEEDTVDFAPNYKESTTEPTVLPSALPNLLMNGSTGIAVGMTTNIPPHNLSEIIDADLRHHRPPLHHRRRTLRDQLHSRPGFPDRRLPSTAAPASKSYLTTGRGIVRMRGKAHTEELKGGIRADHHHGDPVQREPRHARHPHRRARHARRKSTASAISATSPTRTRASSSSSSAASRPRSSSTSFSRRPPSNPPSASPCWPSTRSGRSR